MSKTRLKWVVDTSAPKLQFSFLRARDTHTQLETSEILEKSPFLN